MTAPADPAQRLVDADRRAAEARRRLSSTVAELQDRVDPTRFKNKALADVRVAGDAAADAADRNRGALVGVAAAVGLFLLRGPLLRLFRRAPPRPAPSADAPDAPRAPN